MLRESDSAVKILDSIDDGSTHAHAPDLIDPETTNALLRLVRGGRLRPKTAARMLDAVSASAVVRHPSTFFARPALEFAIAADLSAYDAFYAVLAAVLDVPLVTADRRLAAAVEGSILVA
jgi:predicted nucleic acid-binding protein